MDSPYVPIKFKKSHPSPEELAAVQPFIDFLEDFRFGSLASLHKHVLPSGRATNIRPTGIIQASMKGLIERISKLSSDQVVAEPVYDVEVWVDSVIGIAWTPYDFFLTTDNETKMTHVGTDIIFLAKVDGVWKMIGVADNCRVVKHPGEIPHRYEGPEAQDPAEEKAVLSVFRQVIDTLCTHEYDRIHEFLLPGTVFTFHRGSEVAMVTVDEFIEICHKTLDGKFVSEELLDVNIRIDDDVAMIWSPYKWTEGDDVRFGSDMVTLAKIKGMWKVTGLGNNHGAVA